MTFLKAFCDRYFNSRDRDFLFEGLLLVQF